MTFTSYTFGIFFAIVMVVYWLLHRRTAWQNLILLIASYVFYGYWDLRFMGVLLAISGIGFLGGKQIELTQNPKHKKAYLIVCLTLIGGTLAVLKYYNFFINSVADTAHLFGITTQLSALKWIIPIGISYYVFMSVGYCVDVYRKQTAACQNIVTYFAYISFFPHILSGPIAQSSKLLPQFYQKRSLNRSDVEEGIGLFLWGLFKKLAIADMLAINVSYIFSHYTDLKGSVLVLGLAMYSFQVYADFSGYSDMASGVARLLGFRVGRNFNLPYFSRDIGEFWRRWHMSLSTWMRNYLYIPLGGRGSSKAQYIRNILFVFGFSGLWHGASWNFVVWGLLNGLFFVPYILTNKLKRYDKGVAYHRFLPTLTEAAGMLFTFSLVSMSRVFFRSPDFGTSIGYLQHLFSGSLFSIPDFGTSCFYWIALLVGIEWLQREKSYTLNLNNYHYGLRYAAYLSIIGLLLFMVDTSHQSQFVYFKF